MANPFDVEDPTNPFAGGETYQDNNSAYNPYEPATGYESPAYEQPQKESVPAKPNKPKDIGDVIGKPGDYKDPVLKTI